MSGLGHLGPFPFKDCPQCEKRWPLACFKDMELCFSCMRPKETNESGG